MRARRPAGPVTVRADPLVETQAPSVPPQGVYTVSSEGVAEHVFNSSLNFCTDETYRARSFNLILLRGLATLDGRKWVYLK